MAKPCPICNHEQRAEIEAHIVNRTMTQEGIGKAYGTTALVVSTHRAHIANASKDIWKPSPIVKPALPENVTDAFKREATKAGRKSGVAMHPFCEDITRHLVLKTMQLKAISAKYDLHQDALVRWRDKLDEETKREIHLAARVARAEAVATELNEEAVEVDTGLKRIVREIDLILQRAKDNEDDLLALGSLKEMRQALMDLARLQGQLNQNLTVSVNLMESPQFLTLREIILRVLERHPSAKADFLAEMQRLRIGHAA